MLSPEIYIGQWVHPCPFICVSKLFSRARIHESVKTYDGHIPRPGITELELGPSENSYSRARKRSVIVVLEVGGFHKAV